MIEKLDKNEDKCEKAYLVRAWMVSKSIVSTKSCKHQEIRCQMPDFIFVCVVFFSTFACVACIQTP